MTDDFATLDWRRLCLPSFEELAAIAKDFTFAEMTTIAAVVLWLIVLAMPLTGIDRRDNITGLTYLLYALGTGVALVLAIPLTLREASPATQLTVMAVLLALAGLRWIRVKPVKFSQPDNAEDTGS